MGADGSPAQALRSRPPDGLLTRAALARLGSSGCQAALPAAVPHLALPLHFYQHVLTAAEASSLPTM